MIIFKIFQFFFIFLMMNNDVIGTAKRMRPRVPSYARQSNAVGNIKVTRSLDNVNKQQCGDEDENVVHKLIRNLFKNYNKEAVLEMPIIIHMDVLILQVKNTIEKEGIFESVIALLIDWKDSRMRWSPSEYNNVTFLSLTTDQVWLPDIAMTNSADHLYSISRDNRFTVRVTNDGTFKFVPTGTARTWCGLKLLTFPFDIQKCSMEFESWSLDSETMTFDGKSDLVVDDSFASTQFFLCKYSATTYYHTYGFTGETFTRLRFDFTVKRKSTFYVINLIFPIMILSGIQTLTFLIPSRETTADRIAFGTTNLLTLVVFQTIVTEEMPKTSDAVTALSKYIIALIIMSAGGILESVIVERFQSQTASKPHILLLRLLKHVPTLMRGTAADVKVLNRCNEKVTDLSSHQSSDSLCMSKTLPCKTPSYADSLYSLSNNKEFAVEERRNSYNLAVSLGKLSKNSYTMAEAGVGLVGLSESMKSFQRPQIIESYDRVAVNCKSESTGQRLSNDSSYKSDFDTWLETMTPSSLWSLIAFKIDFVAFVLSVITAISAPVFMFLPLIKLGGDDDCNKNDS